MVMLYISCGRLDSLMSPRDQVQGMAYIFWEEVGYIWNRTHGLVTDCGCKTAVTRIDLCLQVCFHQRCEKDGRDIELVL